MPIYEYRCSHCGYQKEYMQRMSDAPLTDCPKCGKRSLTKLVSAAGFQLKGTGWYATDFKNPAKPAATSSKPEAKQDKAEAKQDKAESKPAESSSKDSSKSEFSCGAGACPACS